MCITDSMKEEQSLKLKLLTDCKLGQYKYKILNFICSVNVVKPLFNIFSLKLISLKNHLINAETSLTGYMVKLHTVRILQIK